MLGGTANSLLILAVISAGAAEPGGKSISVHSAPPASRSAEHGASTPQVDPVSDFVLNAIPGLSKVTLERARTLGKGVREQVRTYPSGWLPGETVEIHEVILDGLTLDIAVHRGRASFLVSATFTNPSWKLLHDLGVGAPEGRVLKVLGKGQRQGNMVTLINTEGAPNVAEFTFGGGVVVRVKLTPYTG